MLQSTEIEFRAFAEAHGEPTLRFFAFAHLPSAQLRAQSETFAELAIQIVETVPRSAERAAGLRKLLEAKDCVIRAALPW